MDRRWARDGLLVQVWTALEKWMQEKGWPPTVRELAEATGINKTAVSEILRRMADLGIVERRKGVARGVRLVKSRLVREALQKPPRRLPTEQGWLQLGSRVVEQDVS